MNYRYYTSGSPTTFESSGDQILNGFQAQLDRYFEVAPDAFIVQEETAIGSEVYTNVDVRVNKAINSYTSEKLGDDFKKLIYKDLAHSAPIGTRYYFDDNYWIVINSEIIKNFAGSSVVRRCNNMLRWIDEYGILYEEPCSVEYSIKSIRDQIKVGSTPVLPEGYVEVYAQLNANTNKIKSSQRFLFGNPDNWICYKVFGEGTRNFLNQKTIDNTSASMLRLYMNVNYDNNDNDDLVNGICDVYKNVYSLSIAPPTVTGNVGQNIELVPTLLLNSNPTSGSISYISSGSAIASMTSNILSLISAGSCNITSYMTNNPDVDCIVPVTVTSTPVNNYEVRINPDSGIILQGDTQTFTVYLYLNGVQQADTFTITIADANVPINKYTLTIIDGNSFSVKNNYMFLDDPLILQLDSGTHTQQFYIYLQGAW